LLLANTDPKKFTANIKSQLKACNQNKVMSGFPNDQGSRDTDRI